MNKDIVKKAVRIITAYMEEDLPAELGAKIRSWLMTESNSEEKTAAIEELFYKNIEYNPIPSSKVLYDYEQMSLRLGFAAAPPAGEKKRITPIRKIIVRVAAVVIPIMILAGTLMVYTERYFEKTGQQIAAASEQLSAGDTFEEIMLGDGTFIKLYPGSRISYQKNYMDDRRINLNGEADFNVADNGNAFNVIAGEMTVSVLGTEFNVKAYDDRNSASVTLYKGKVSVEAYGKTIMMAPGEVLEVNHADGEISVSHISQEQMQTYNNSGLVFEEGTLQDVFDKLEKAYGMRFRIIGNLSTTDIIQADFTDCIELEEILWVLEQISNEHFSFRISGDEVIIQKE